MHPEPALAVSDLVMRYGTTTALDGVSLSVDPGSLVALLGPNGAGKTTLMETVAGLRTPGRGTASVHGHDARDAAALRTVLALQPQDGSLLPHLRVGEAVELWQAIYSDAADPAPILATLELTTTNAVIDRLSGGQRRRLLVALTLIADRAVVCLDEPTASLDPIGRMALWDVVRERHAAGRTIVVSTHLIDEAEALAERIVVLARGRIVGDGTSGELCAATGTTSLTDAYVALAGARAAADSEMEDAR